MHTPPTLDIDTWRADDTDLDTDVESVDDSEPGTVPALVGVWFSADHLSVYAATTGETPTQEEGYGRWWRLDTYNGVTSWTAFRVHIIGAAPTAREMADADDMDWTMGVSGGGS
jgi:hypothetical protein